MAVVAEETVAVAAGLSGSCLPWHQQGLDQEVHRGNPMVPATGQDSGELHAALPPGGGTLGSGESCAALAWFCVLEPRMYIHHSSPFYMSKIILGRRFYYLISEIVKKRSFM